MKPGTTPMVQVNVSVPDRPSTIRRSSARPYMRRNDTTLSKNIMNGSTGTT
ncbi:hypothetical protein LFM09_41170 [Lentzea alba]|uniref:hypothetical protein n=1 Tax=Lentzea alba TaxID=2714351 RepID=UPI0039BF0E16